MSWLFCNPDMFVRAKFTWSYGIFFASTPLTLACFSSLCDLDFNSKTVASWANIIVLGQGMFNVQWTHLCPQFMKHDMFECFPQVEVKWKEFKDSMGAWRVNSDWNNPTKPATWLQKKHASLYLFVLFRTVNNHCYIFR